MSSRRDFLKVFASAVASVAIGLRVAHGMPKLPDVCPMDDIPTVIPMEVKIHVNPEITLTDWRVVYGSPSE